MICKICHGFDAFEHFCSVCHVSIFNQLLITHKDILEEAICYVKVAHDFCENEEEIVKNMISPISIADIDRMLESEL